MAKGQGRVLFGLKKVYWAAWDDEGSKYGEPKAWPGAVTLSLDKQGDTDTFYADDGPYATFSSNGGYSGSIESAVVPEEFLVECVGMTKDSNGAIVEATDGEPKEFALMFEVASNKEPERLVLYSCTASRPGVNANTRTSSTTPDTQTVDVVCGAHAFTVDGTEHDYVLGKLRRTSTNAAVYAKFFEKVYEPGQSGE